MATLGVGDAISAISFLIDVAEKISSANKKIQNIQKDIRRVKVQLELVRDRINDPNSFFGRADDRM